MAADHLMALFRWASGRSLDRRSRIREDPDGGPPLASTGKRSAAASAMPGLGVSRRNVAVRRLRPTACRTSGALRDAGIPSRVTRRMPNAGGPGAGALGDVGEKAASHRPGGDQVIAVPEDG
jgi:hypothetical protein